MCIMRLTQARVGEIQWEEQRIAAEVSAGNQKVESMHNLLEQQRIAGTAEPMKHGVWRV